MNNKKSFNKKHLIIMALGNIIGSGIFLGSSTVISVAGPAAIFSYLLGGVLMIFEVMFITEMTIVNPAPGSFRVHASEVFGPWIGFVNGWTFWLSGVFGMASEVTAAAIFTKFWLPHVPLWIFCIAYTVIMTFINLKDLKGLSKIESYLSSFKIIALVLFILLGIFLATGMIHLNELKFTNPFRSAQSFLPKGFKGILSAMIMVMFSYTGTGIIGLAIADTEDPAKNAPSAILTITISVIILYTLSILFLIMLAPWHSLSSDQSPFVFIFEKMGIPFSSGIFNIVVLSASLSGLNSGMYSSSRMLNSLSRDKQASKLFLKTNQNGVPIYAVGISSLTLLITAILSYFLPEKVFLILATASGFLAMINWLTISITHYFYRKKTLSEKPEKLKFKVAGYPYTTFLEIFLILAILATSPLYPGQISGLITSVILLIFVFIIYFICKKLKILR